MTARGVARSIKNYAKGFSDAQIKVREATSNDPWGPSGTLMNEIAQLTYNEHDFVEIMDMIDRRLNDKGKNWRHVFKALLLLDYCLHVGSENVVLYAKENIYVVKTLKEFQHVDDNGRDVGANVRQKAKDVTALLNDDARLKEERRSRQHMRERMAGVGDYMNETLYGRSGPPDGSVYERPGYLDEDRDLQRAMEESRRMARDEARNREQSDEDLARAIELSEQEAKEQERRRREKLERENAKSLFENGESTTQNTGFNPFPANQAFDSSHNPYTSTQQFPQMTGMTNMSFQDPIAAQQRTGFGNGFSNPYQQGGSLSPWGAFGNNIQAQMTGMPQQTQFTGLAPFQTNPSMGFSMQQQQQQPQFTGATNLQTSTATGIQSNNPFGQFGSTSQAQTLQPQQTGFTSQALSMQPTGLATPVNTQQTATPQTATSSFTPSAQTASSTPVNQTTAGSTRPVDPRYAKLDALLASREDGTDTFGNTGNLRIPVGTGFANSLKPEYTGVQRSSSTGNLVDVSSSSNDNNTSLSFSKSFGDQNSHNPFAPGNSSSHSAGNTPMVQPQFPQATGMAPLQSQVTGMAPMQAQMTGMQPQMTGFGAFGQQQQHQQQQPSLF